MAERGGHGASGGSRKAGIGRKRAAESDEDARVTKKQRREPSALEAPPTTGKRKRKQIQEEDEEIGTLGGGQIIGRPRGAGAANGSGELDGEHFSEELPTYKRVPTADMRPMHLPLAAGESGVPVMLDTPDKATTGGGDDSGAPGDEYGSPAEDSPATAPVESTQSPTPVGPIVSVTALATARSAGVIQSKSKSTPISVVPRLTDTNGAFVRPFSGSKTSVISGSSVMMIPNLAFMSPNLRTRDRAPQAPVREDPSRTLTYVEDGNTWSEWKLPSAVHAPSFRRKQAPQQQRPEQTPRERALEQAPLEQAPQEQRPRSRIQKILVHVQPSAVVAPSAPQKQTRQRTAHLNEEPAVNEQDGESDSDNSGDEDYTTPVGANPSLNAIGKQMVQKMQALTEYTCDPINLSHGNTEAMRAKVEVLHLGTGDATRCVATNRVLQGGTQAYYQDRLTREYGIDVTCFMAGQPNISKNRDTCDQIVLSMERICTYNYLGSASPEYQRVSRIDDRASYQGSPRSYESYQGRMNSPKTAWYRAESPVSELPMMTNQDHVDITRAPGRLDDYEVGGAVAQRKNNKIGYRHKLGINYAAKHSGEILVSNLTSLSVRSNKLVGARTEYDAMREAQSAGQLWRPVVALFDALESSPDTVTLATSYKLNHLCTTTALLLDKVNQAGMTAARGMVPTVAQSLAKDLPAEWLARIQETLHVVLNEREKPFEVLQAELETEHRTRLTQLATNLHVAVENHCLESMREPLNILQNFGVSFDTPEGLKIKTNMIKALEMLAVALPHQIDLLRAEVQADDFLRVKQLLWVRDAAATFFAGQFGEVITQASCYVLHNDPDTTWLNVRRNLARLGYAADEGCPVIRKLRQRVMCGQLIDPLFSYQKLIKLQKEALLWVNEDNALPELAEALDWSKQLVASRETERTMKQLALVAQLETSGDVHEVEAVLMGNVLLYADRHLFNCPALTVYLHAARPIVQILKFTELFRQHHHLGLMTVFHHKGLPIPEVLTSKARCTWEDLAALRQAIDELYTEARSHDLDTLVQAMHACPDTPEGRKRLYELRYVGRGWGLCLGNTPHGILPPVDDFQWRLLGYLDAQGVTEQFPPKCVRQKARRMGRHIMSTQSPEKYQGEEARQLLMLQTGCPRLHVRQLIGDLRKCHGLTVPQYRHEPEFLQAVATIFEKTAYPDLPTREGLALKYKKDVKQVDGAFAYLRRKSKRLQPTGA